MTEKGAIPPFPKGQGILAQNLMKNSNKKQLFRKKIQLEKVFIDLEAVNHRPSFVLVDIINSETEKLIAKYQHLKEEYCNNVVVSNLMEPYGHDGAFDFYLVATIMESEQDYKKRLEEHHQKQIAFLEKNKKQQLKN